MDITDAQRGTPNRATANRLSMPDTPLMHLPPFWNLMGPGAVPDVLTDALETQIQLGAALLHGPVEQLYPLAERLMADWQFLLDAQEKSQHDPRDGALLVADLSHTLAEVKSVEIVTLSTGESIPITRQIQEVPLPVWAPTEFPRGMAKTLIARYPKRPRDVGEIPPFQPENVRQW